MQPPKKKPNRMKQQYSLKHKLNTNEEKTLKQVTKKKKKQNAIKIFVYTKHSSIIPSRRNSGDALKYFASLNV